VSLYVLFVQRCEDSRASAGRARRILSEDKAMVEELRPDMLQREISVKADLPQMAFRKLRQEYVDMGYGVLPEAAAQRFRGADQ